MASGWSSALSQEAKVPWPDWLSAWDWGAWLAVTHSTFWPFPTYIPIDVGLANYAWLLKLAEMCFTRVRTKFRWNWENLSKTSCSIAKAASFSFVFLFSFCVLHCVMSQITSYCKACSFTDLFPRASVLLLSIIGLVTWVKAWLSHLGSPHLAAPMNLNNTPHPSIVPSMAASATVNPLRCGDISVTACASPCVPPAPRPETVPVRGHACLNRQPDRHGKQTFTHARIGGNPLGRM